MKLIISNHKNGLSDDKLNDYLSNINSLDTSNIKLIICPSMKHLISFKNSNCILGSQDIENNNLEYLKNNRVEYTIVGHS